MTTTQRKAAAHDWADAIKQTAENDPQQRMQLCRALVDLLKAWEGIKTGEDELWETIVAYGPEGISNKALSIASGVVPERISQKAKVWMRVGLLTKTQHGTTSMYAANLETLMQLTNFEKTMAEHANTTIPEILAKCTVLSLPLDLVIYTRLLQKEMTVSGLMESLNTLDQSRVSTSLARLRRENLASSTTEGNKRLYRSNLGILFAFDRARECFVETGIITLPEPDIK